MSEELNVNTEIVNENPTVEEPETKPETKTFTQDEVNKLLAERLGRVKTKYADYDEIKTKASEYEKALEEKRLAELTAQERAEEIAKKYEAERNEYAKQLETLKAEAQREKIVNAFIKAAPSVAIPADRIDAALKLVDMSAVNIEDGKVVGLEDALATLVEQYGFLAETKKPQKPIGEATNSPKDTADKTSEQLLNDAIAKAKRTNRIEDRMAVASLKRELGM